MKLSCVTVPCDLCAGEDCQPILEKFGLHYARCKDCGFVFTNPRPQDATSENNQIFQARLERYAEKFTSRKNQRQYERDLRLLDPHRGEGRLLEVGSNVGAFLFKARQMGWSALGVEPADACARYGRERHGLEILTATLEEANLPQNHFDVAYSNAVFEHLPSPSAAFKAAFGVLRPGGVLYVDTVNFDSYTRRLVGNDWKLLDPRAHLSLFTPGTLRRFCEQAGFRVLRIATHGVRFRANQGRKLRGIARWSEELAKLPLSIACRLTLKGDSISVLAQKPLIR